MLVTFSVVGIHLFDLPEDGSDVRVTLCIHLQAYTNTKYLSNNIDTQCMQRVHTLQEYNRTK